MDETSDTQARDRRAPRSASLPRAGVETASHSTPRGGQLEARSITRSSVDAELTVVLASPSPRLDFTLRTSAPAPTAILITPRAGPLKQAVGARHGGGILVIFPGSDPAVTTDV